MAPEWLNRIIKREPRLKDAAPNVQKPPVSERPKYVAPQDAKAESGEAAEKRQVLAALEEGGSLRYFYLEGGVAVTEAPNVVEVSNGKEAE